MSGGCRDWPCDPGSGCPTCDPAGHKALSRRLGDEPRCHVCDGKLLPHLGSSTVDGKRVHDGCKAKAVLDSYPHVCPDCRGAGQKVVAWSAEKRCCNGGEPKYGGHGGFAGCEYCPDLQERKTPSKTETCGLCEGRGRLKVPAVPVMTQTGWKRG